jgi:hypothetical protein
VSDIPPIAESEREIVYEALAAGALGVDGIMLRLAQLSEGTRKRIQMVIDDLIDRDLVYQQEPRDIGVRIYKVLPRVGQIGSRSRPSDLAE